MATQRWEHPLLTALIALLCLEVVALCAFVWIAQPMGAGVWWPLSMANLLVAGGTAAYLFRPHAIGSEVLSELWRSATGDGIAAGLAGAAAVAVWFLLYDSVTAGETGYCQGDRDCR